MTFQAKLVTKSEKYSVDDTIIELKNNVELNELNDIIVKLLKQLDRYDEAKINGRKFDFLIGGRIIRLNVEEHLKLYSDEIDVEEVLSEKLVEVEYFLSQEPPKPLDALPHEDWVSCVDANDTYIVSGSYDNSIRLFSIETRKELINIPDAHKKPVTRVKFVKPTDQARKNEVYFISCGHDEVSIMRKFNTKSMKVETVCEYKGHNRSIHCVDIHDDLIGTGSFDKTLRIWSNGNSIMTLTGHQEAVTGVKWMDSYSTIATCSMDRSINIWDVEVGECKRRVLSAKPLLGIDFCNRRNLILSASCDRHIRIWDARAPDNATAKTAYTSHSAWVSSVAFGASENNFISGGYDNLVKLWDLRSSKACLFDMIGHHDKVMDVNWSNPGYVLSGSADATLKIFKC